MQKQQMFVMPDDCHLRGEFVRLKSGDAFEGKLTRHSDVVEEHSEINWTGKSVFFLPQAKEDDQFVLEWMCSTCTVDCGQIRRCNIGGYPIAS